MSFNGLHHLNRVSNETTIPGIVHLPTSILDAFIPGYSFISKYLLDVFGFDISIIVSTLVLGFACTTGIHYLYRHLWATFLTYFTASVVIDAYDIIYDNLLSWAAEQEDLKRVRSLKAQSADYTDEVDELNGNNSSQAGAIFNFNSWAAKVPPRYEPDAGYHWFRHHGHWFKFSRENHKVQGGWMGMVIQDQETIRLTVLGRSTQPIKDLILDTRDRTLSRQIAKTTVRRPSPKEQRGRGRQAWSKIAVRPSRPMGTVVLDSTLKAAILRDINDFLDPATNRWYSSRGIPYRRGYLLSGPSGVGKTSLSFALAGVFGLDIYCMSLSEKTLSEEDLILLFNSLPKRCIVLLEDIDSAGVTRKKNEAKDEEEKSTDKAQDKKAETESEKKDDSAERTAAMIVKEVNKAIKAANSDHGDRSFGGRSGSANDAGITMSGLLNAIDGVASQEGRVLIMTTNYPEKLDEALIRPGRVDMKIAFTLASRQQIRELFLRMYCIDSREATRVPTNLKQIMPDVLDGVEDAASMRKKYQTREKEKVDLLQPPAARLLPMSPPHTPSTSTSPSSPSRRPSSSSAATDPSPSSIPRLDSSFSTPSQSSPELEAMAEKFASFLPEATFSPAEVQSFLIMRKKDPWRAVEEVEQWRDVEVGKKREKMEREGKKEMEGKQEKEKEKEGEKEKEKEKDGKGGEEEKTDQGQSERKEHGQQGPGTEPSTSTTDHLVASAPTREADLSDRGGHRAGTNGQRAAVVDDDAEGPTTRWPESGTTALLGNTQGICRDRDGDGDGDGDGEGSGDEGSGDEGGVTDDEEGGSGSGSGSDSGSGSEESGCEEEEDG